MQAIPLSALPAQQIAATLSGQACKIVVRQLTTGLFLSLYVNDALLVGSVICQNANRLVRGAYLGFVGNLAFIDTQGTSDPEYLGLGTRYVLVYLEAGE